MKGKGKRRKGIKVKHSDRWVKSIKERKEKKTKKHPDRKKKKTKYKFNEK